MRDHAASRNQLTGRLEYQDNAPKKIADAIEGANEAVTAEALQRVQQRHPAFLEELVLLILTAMGYGGPTGPTKHLGRSGDGGLDGVIRQDPLGLDQIYVRTKGYAADRVVGRPDIRPARPKAPVGSAEIELELSTNRWFSASHRTEIEHQSGARDE
jgi:restriction system protein